MPTTNLIMNQKASADNQRKSSQESKVFLYHDVILCSHSQIINVYIKYNKFINQIFILN